MNSSLTIDERDWSPILNRIQPVEGHSLPTYPGDLKSALLDYVGLTNHPQGEKAYQMSVEIARLTTCCDPEVVYWFSRLITLLTPETRY